MLHLSLQSSGHTGLWQVPRVAPVAVLGGTPKFPPQAALPPLSLFLLVSLACALGLEQVPWSCSGWGLRTPALMTFPSSVCQDLPWGGGPKIRDFSQQPIPAPPPPRSCLFTNSSLERRKSFSAP